MKKTYITLFTVAIAIALSSLTLYKSNEDTSAASRGKVVADSKSGLFNLNLNEASFFSFITGNNAIEDIEGQVCILDENDEPTGEYIRMVPRSFPSWFKFGCEDGTIVTYKIVEKGNGEKQANVKVGKKPKD